MKIFRNKDNIVNRCKLIYAPIFMVLITILILGVSNFSNSKKLLLKQSQEYGYNIANQVIKQIEINQIALETIDKMLENQIRKVANIVIKNEDKLSESFLNEIKSDLGVDQIHWISADGNTIYTTTKGYEQWRPYVGHPLYDFMHSNNKELMEKIRPDAEFEIPIKYGAIKNKNGEFVQVGILAKNINKITENLNYQTLVEEIVKDNNIVYVSILDNDLISVASSSVEEIGSIYNRKDNIINSEIIDFEMKEWYCPELEKNILEILVPINIRGKVNGVFVLGISMNRVYDSIFDILKNSISVASFMFIVFLWFQNKNIIIPVKKIDFNINQIDIENNMGYRLKLEKSDPFFGVVCSINLLLNKIENYVYELKEYKEELEISNEEIIETYQQISSAEEELRAQYDEIQSYSLNLEKLKQKYEIAIEGTNSAVWEIDMIEKSIYLSKEFQNVIEHKFIKQEKFDRVFYELFGNEDKIRLLEEINNCENMKKKEFYAELEMKDNNGEICFLLMRGKCIYKKEKLININGIFLDITELKEKEIYIEHLAYNDHLTKLPNRRSFLEELENSISRNEFGAVMLLDLDNFKGINDTLGHKYGDEVLKKVAELLLTIKDNRTFISRFGGDEFLILVENVDDFLEIENYAKQISNLFRKKLYVDDRDVHIGCSIGITRYPIESKEVNQLIMNADMAMYKVKDLGTSGYMFFKKEMTDQLIEEVHIEQYLRDALEHDGFELFYQPQVCVETLELKGFEALIRLKSYDISPAIFIPLAEKLGLIVDIGRVVTKKVIKQLAKWKENNMNIKPVAINFSANQINDLNYLSFLKNELSVNNINGKFIEIEITESIFLDNKKEIISFLNKLKKMDIKIALDDFGTGYSSISYLTFLPVDKIKLDKSLCDKFLESKNISIMDNIIALAQSLNLEVLAEGVERVEQYEKLRVGKCDYIQGYLFSKPLSIDKIREVKMLDDNRYYFNKDFNDF